MLSHINHGESHFIIMSYCNSSFCHNSCKDHCSPVCMFPNMFFVKTSLSWPILLIMLIIVIMQDALSVCLYKPPVSYCTEGCVGACLTIQRVVVKLV